MGEGRSEERRFLEDLERLLAGEEITPGEEASADHVSAIEFARKLADLSEGPSEEFQQQLKQRLLMKLTERDVADREAARAGGFRRFLGSLVPHSPVWRTAAVTVTIVLVATGVMWGTGMFTAAPAAESELAAMQADGALKKGMAVSEAAPTPRAEATQEEADEAPAPKKAPIPPLPEITLSIPAAPAELVVSVQGEDTVVTLSFTNPTSEPVTVKQWPPAFSIVARSDSQPVRVLPAGDTVVEMAASGTLEHTLTWDQKDAQGQQVPPGYYLIMPEVLLEGEEGQEILISGPAIRVLVAFPQGAMEKSIEVNRTVTVGDNAATLERVELSALGVSVYVLVTLPDYTPPPPAGAMSPPDPALPVTAHYSVDGGPAREARGDGQHYVNHDIGDDIALSWTELDPVPSDARTLTFTITQLGVWEGPWEFVIALGD